MSTVHLTQIFATGSPAIFEECDRLMQELLDREQADATVRDASVAADAGIGIVEVEVVADGDSRDDAEQAAVSRIRAAVTSIVRLEGDAAMLREKDRTTELVTV